jgi:RNA polymerase sigma-70 factor (ECF subfamily)
LTNQGATADLADLLARSALGERDAFAALYRASAGRLFALALRILKRRDLAEEVLQDSFVKIWHHAGDYRPERAAPYTWLATIVRNRALDALRAAPPEDAGGDDASFDLRRDEDPGPLELAMASQDARALARCMETLAPPQRRMIAASFLQGLSHSELAKAAGEPIGTVKTWIRRGLQQLRRCLAPD